GSGATGNDPPGCDGGQAPLGGALWPGRRAREHPHADQASSPRLMVRIRFGWLSRLELGLTVLGLTLPSRGLAAGVRGCVLSAAEATEARGRGAEWPTRIAELA